jgi:restriction system protein
MPIPDYQTLMLPVLQFVAQGEVRLSDLIKSLATKLELSEEEKTELLRSGRQTVFANWVGWAKTYLKKAELLEYPKRGYCRITKSGQKVLASNISKIDNTFLTQFDGFRQFKDISLEEADRDPLDILTDRDSHTPDEIIRLVHSQIEAALAEEILERILACPPDFFERLIVTLLISMGYGGSTKDAGKALGRSGDNGVDGVIDQDSLGLDRVYIQAKRYVPSNSIGSGSIRDFFGSLDRHKASKGLFVTTSTFSDSAKETAEFLSKRIVLIDGRQLTKLMIRYNVGCRIEETLYLKKIDE